MQTIDAGAVWRGALTGLLIIVPLTALRAVLDRKSDVEEGGWLLLFGLGLLLAYVVAGAVAGYRAPGTPLTNGILAGIGAFVLWVPLRILIWVARSETQGLIDGREPVFTFGQLFGQLLFAAVFGLVGAVIGARRARASSMAGDRR